MDNQAIFDKANEVFEKVVGFRRHIHKNPELSFQEYNTSSFIKSILDEYKIEYRAIANTGVVATIGADRSKCIALRADIDALPILEETELDFASANEGVMHACGHDMHTSMLLGTAIILKSYEAELNGTVKLLFQPGEEVLPGGATMMIVEGVLENPKVDAIFGQHIFPDAKTGTISFCEGRAFASTNEIYITIHGKGSHAAQPHSGNDPILTAAHLIQHFQTLINKKRNPLEPGVLSITSINGGNTTNIFPEKVELKGTLRTYNEDWRQEMVKLIGETTNVIASLHNCTAEVNIVTGYSPIVNSPIETQKAKQIAINLLGDDYVYDYEPRLWAEDFAYYLQQVPGTFWLLGVQPHDKDFLPPLHNSKLIPEEKAMITGISMFVKTVFEYFKS
ncbi:MAG: amidohydrolase [Desulfobulbaceae bacterium]|nr:amidohydrolase [Candidatus Kapabacteria bacterium]MBS3999903.1 amidohydrolase [Desulfobulbaceae bacterium]